MGLREQIRILVVDDMATSRGLIIQSLDKIGIKNVDFVKNGKEALEALAKKPAHLIISDLNMPVMDGFGLLQKLRATPALKKVGFILVTGSADKDTVVKGQQLGMNNYIAKPFTPESMMACIERVVGKL